MLIWLLQANHLVLDGPHLHKVEPSHCVVPYPSFTAQSDLLLSLGNERNLMTPHQPWIGCAILLFLSGLPALRMKENHVFWPWSWPQATSCLLLLQGAFMNLTFSKCFALFGLFQTRANTIWSKFTLQLRFKWTCSLTTDKTSQLMTYDTNVSTQCY